MQWLADICVRRPVFATVIILALVVVGIAGYAKLGVDRFPKVDFPVITVTTRLPGAAPEEVETEISDKIEDKQVRRAIENINGVGQVLILGGRSRQINIWLDPLHLRAAGITAIDVQRALQSQNVQIPGGSLETGPTQLTVRIRGRVTSV